MSVCPSCRARYADGRFCPADGSALVAEDLTPVIPGLEIGVELGRGLTGIVWRAKDAEGHVLALKVLHHEWAEHPEMRERFLREARAAAAVAHPCVVAPLATGLLDDGRPYLVMELVDGPSLEEVLALGPLPEARAAAIGADLASALAAVHRAGVVHRDVKPGNVKIGRDGRARLLDFGVARRLDSDEPRLTGGGLTVGTPHYMAPEQCTGDVITGRTDVYALGCVLYRMLSGAVPFDGAAVAVMLAHAAREPAPLRERATVSTAMSRLVDRCLAKRAGDRPDAAEVAEVLTALAVGSKTPSVATKLQFGRASTMPAERFDWGEAPADATSQLPLAASVVSPFAAPSDVLSRSDIVTSRLPMTRQRRSVGRRLFRATFALAIVAVALLVFNTTEIGHGLAHRVGLHFHPDLPFVGDGPAAKPVEPATPPPAPADDRAYLIAADEGVALRLGAPGHLPPGVEHELTVEAWNAEGDPIDTNDLVVTFAGPDGALVGFAAEPTRDRGTYRVRTRFARAGAWTVRVFPPIGDAMVTFRLDVGDAIPST